MTLPSANPGALLLSVIIPAHNEARSICSVCRRVEATGHSLEIIVVDDGSDDATGEAVLQEPTNVRTTVLFHERNLGKGAAVRSAIPFVHGAFVVIQDADLEYDPADYEALLTAASTRDVDIVYGVRRDMRHPWSPYYIAARVLTVLTNLLYGAELHDQATCYKLFRRSVLARVALRATGFDFCSEVTAKVLRLGYTIAEVPIAYEPRTIGQGKQIRTRHGLMALWRLLAVRVQTRRYIERPSGAALEPPFGLVRVVVRAPDRLPQDAMVYHGRVDSDRDEGAVPMSIDGCL